MEWTEEIIQSLRSLWDDGLSTVKIGRHLGVSKSAVIGKAHRLHLPARRTRTCPHLKLDEKVQDQAMNASLPGITPRPISVVEIAHKRISTALIAGDAEYGLEPVDEAQAGRIAALAVGAMLVDGLWLEAGTAKMNMEFPLRPDTSVTIVFKGRPIQSDLDTLIKVLETLKATLPERIEIAPDGYSPGRSVTSQAV